MKLMWKDEDMVDDRPIGPMWLEVTTSMSRKVVFVSQGWVTRSEATNLAIRLDADYEDA